MTAFTIIDTALLVLAIIYIVALLRSHADILRRLAVLEEGGGAQPSAPSAPAVGGLEVLTSHEISGLTLAGDAVVLSFGAGSPVTLLAFLTSGCASCAPLWASMGEAPAFETPAERIVIVTHDASRESPERVRGLAPSGVEVVMASAAWEDYAVPASPHFVLTDGAGGILGRGAALSWSQLLTMVDDARADAAGAAGAAGATGAAGSPGAGGADAMPARTTAERAARSAQTLRGAGIGPGHPSLYPSALGENHLEDR
jgi:hypothetical protein